MKYSYKSVLLLSTMALLLMTSCRFSAGPDSGLSEIPARPAAPVDTTGTDATATVDPSGVAYGAVNEPVTVLWSNPGQLRDYDRLILNKPSNPAAWAGGMDTDMRLWLVGKAETHALYGEPVVILERRGDWLRVAATKQRSTLNEYGYPGWVPASHIVIDQTYINELESLPSVIVAKPLTNLYSNKELTDISIEISYQTRLPVLEEQEQVVAVRLPAGNTGYLSLHDVKKAGGLTFSRGEMTAEAKDFLGLRYIWAGTSSYGFDCSGFTMRLYQSQGVSIPRDADEQAREGIMVAKSELLPGDLLFFAAKMGQGQIHHVSMYIGNGMMIHSPGSSASVRIDPIDSGIYREEFWGAKRYVP
ncbi:MAG: Gamma-D-glutamyl-L-lysine endopeptidase [Pelotomaculum sp. PtaU1.Bin035]|nr:MAG: Gamma-D-glutamyl-L-lysine endopeptidase [Pelotomaculum sp. PtaU1.Bin035]